jgi:ubiquinone/menaquinone biosynthesis C-methylase UbiE
MVLVDYYGELCTKVYESDKSLEGEKELAFYLSFVKDKTMKVLEPMCGNGRMLIPFMEKGVDIEGFDISEEMLKVCK